MESPETVLDQVKAAIGGGQAEVSLEVEAGPPAHKGLTEFLTRLKAVRPQFAGPARLRTSDGVTCAVLAADTTSRIAVAVVDIDAWRADAAAWGSDLKTHSTFRTAGWRVLRLPLVWSGTEQAENLLRVLVASTGDFAQTPH